MIGSFTCTFGLSFVPTGTVGCLETAIGWPMIALLVQHSDQENESQTTGNHDGLLLT